MQLLVQQMLTVVLSINAHQLFAQCFQVGKGRRTTIDAALVAPVGKHLPADEQLPFLGLKALFPCQFQHLFGQIGKGARHTGLALPGADQITADTAAQNGAEGINDNGFTCAGLAGQHGKAGRKIDVGLLNHSDIFNIQIAQHNPVFS